MHRASAMAHPSADRSAEMNETTGNKKAAANGKALDCLQPSHRSPCIQRFPYHNSGVNESRAMEHTSLGSQIWRDAMDASKQVPRRHATRQHVLDGRECWHNLASVPHQRDGSEKPAVSTAGERKAIFLSPASRDGWPGAGFKSRQQLPLIR
jgi:hypothetical protein